MRYYEMQNGLVPASCALWLVKVDYDTFLISKYSMMISFKNRLDYSQAVAGEGKRGNLELIK